MSPGIGHLVSSPRPGVTVERSVDRKACRDTLRGSSRYFVKGKDLS